MCNVNVSLSAQFIRSNSDSRKKTSHTHTYPHAENKWSECYQRDIECDSIFPSTHLLSYLVACVHIQCRAAILLLTLCAMSFPQFDMVCREIRWYRGRPTTTLCVDFSHIVHECDVIAVAFHWFDFCCCFDVYFRLARHMRCRKWHNENMTQTRFSLFFFSLLTAPHTNEMNANKHQHQHTLERCARLLFGEPINCVVFL